MSIHYVSLTGKVAINGRSLTSVRAAEILYLMAHEGPALSKVRVEEIIYGGFVSRSALWNIVKKIRDFGVSIGYDRGSRRIVLTDQLVFDIDIAMSYLSDGDYRAALWVLDGWPLLRGGDGYSRLINERLRDALESCPLAKVRDNVGKISYILDHGQVEPE